MDKLSRLQKLLGDENAVTDTSAFDTLTVGSGVKAQHLYEGSSDSEDGVLRIDAIVVAPKVNKSKASKGKKSTNEVAAQAVVRLSGKSCTKPCLEFVCQANWHNQGPKSMTKRINFSLESLLLKTRYSVLGEL